MEYPDGNYIVNFNDSSDKKIAIYGDSFGDGYALEGHHGAVNIASWWPSILASKMQVHSLYNFCAGGSPFLHTYKNFLGNYKNFEINIVLVTEPFRYTKRITLPSIYPKSKYHASNVGQLEFYKKTYDLLQFEIDIIDELIAWHMAKDRDYIAISHNLMIDHIKRISPETIIIPCFNHSTDVPHGLHEFVEYQYKSLGISDYDEFSKYDERKDVMSCHFTPDMNRIVADRVFNGITTGNWDWSNPNMQHEHPLEYYYEKTR